MKITSKSILSPGRAMARDPPNSLSTSLSRRLRASGSIKGGASPAMFPTAARKRTFENPEPSSPKVTCIGQVRVRGKKKQAKKLRTLSRRHSSGEVSFRKLDLPLSGVHSKDHNHQESSNLGPNGSRNNNRNQIQECSQVQRSWVHFPVTICEALRAFGSEFSCLIPCRTERGKEEEKTVAAGDDHRGGSCGAVFTRWLVAVQEGDGGGGKDIELVIGDEEEEDEDEDEEIVVRRRHVFEDLEIVDGRIGGDNGEGRVSVCVPPKNALLLMRCRSDPMKVEALSSGSWEPSDARYEEEDEEFVDCENQIEKDQENVFEADKDQEQQNVQQVEANHDQEDDNVQLDYANHDQEDDNVQLDYANQDQELDNVERDEANLDQELDNVEQDDANQDQELDNMELDEANQDQEQEHDNVLQFEASQDQEHDNLQEDEAGQDQEHEQTEIEEESFHLASLFEEFMNQDYQIQEHDEAHEVAESESSTMATKFTEISKTHEEEEELLPDCLLMMMHEPKLSINVSKETWVCSKDFIKRPNKRKPPPPPLPPPPVVNTDGGLTAALPQPARSSCSLPVAPSMATLLEQKLANAVGYEPFVLTRCKSEPMRTAASKLLPESCVWENRMLERLSGVGFGVGSAGLGF